MTCYYSDSVSLIQFSVVPPSDADMTAIGLLPASQRVLLSSNLYFYFVIDNSLFVAKLAIRHR